MRKVRWVDVLEIRNGKSQKKVANPKGLFPIYGSGGMMGFADEFICPALTTIIGRKGSINNPLFIEEKFWNVDTAFGLVAGSDLDPKYLYYFCLRYDFLKHNVATTLPSLRKADLYKIEMHLPLLKNQRRIAHRLDLIDRLRRSLRTEIATYDKLGESVFLEMFGLTNEYRETWPIRSFKSLALPQKGSMRTGPFGSDLLHSEFVDEGISVLGIDNVVQNKFSWGKRRYITKSKYQSLSRYKVYPGDVLVSIMGTVGRVAVVPADIGVAINTKHLAAITFDNDLVDPSFIAFSLQKDPYIKFQIANQGRGAIMTGLNLTIIKNIEIPLPPLKSQRQFATHIRYLDGLKAKAEAALAEADDLFNGALQEVFG